MDKLYKGFWYYVRRRQNGTFRAVAGREGMRAFDFVDGKDHFETPPEYGKGAKQRALQALFAMIDRSLEGA